MKKTKSKNIFAKASKLKGKEIFESIFANKKIKIERIISHGEFTEKEKWLKEERDEWVMLLQGAAKLRFRKDNSIIKLNPGDYLLIPKHTFHRVDWTSSHEKTIWLAVYS